MNTSLRVWCGCLCAQAVGLALLASCFSVAGAPKEQRFELLQIGTRSFTNATVTTKASNYIFILHSGGMESVKLSALSPELREQLGYVVPKPKTNTVQNWTKAQVGKINTKAVTGLSQSFMKRLPSRPADLAKADPYVLTATAAVLLAFHFFFSYCAFLICQKTGHKPGALVWIPLLQLLPLIQAAGMPGLWLLAWLVPGVNLAAYVLWCIKISCARNKGKGTALLLILPITTPFAFIYLAFSRGNPPAEPTPRRPEIMTLEAA